MNHDHSPAEVPPNCPVETSRLPGTEVTYDDGNNGVIYVNARNHTSQAVIFHLLATTSNRGRPDELICWPPVTVQPHDVVVVHTEYDPAGGTFYGTHLTLWHSRFAAPPQP